ncbi:MAG: acyl-CoA/acyl-ACP dehydrogenase [Sorangiineae bacterium]|nr:acyl-CoA/acyl-ACP dehydrogenase [Polyangiaceae bacterium]MEB2323292.1 acyl-CoA/acyl-ACP dehydrogenase [Sorangiineae bacterium]
MSGGERQLLRTSVARFAAEALEPLTEALEQGESLPPAVVDGLRALGLFQLGAAPEEIALLGVALETLADVSPAAASLVLANAAARALLLDAPSSAARARALEAPGPLAYPLYADISEQIADGGAWELVVGAGPASHLVLPFDESSVLIVASEATSIRLGPLLLTLGMRGCPTKDAQLLEPAASSRVEVDVRRALARLRAPAAAICAGIVGRSLRTATDYAQSRYQAGALIIEHQEVRAMLARMLADHAACHDAVERLASGELPAPLARARFIEAKERAARATLDGVQLLGGNGYMEAYGQERCLRDARQAACCFGRLEVERQALLGEWLEGAAGA